jgi:adenine-specific DNA-methyltransferase
MPFFHFALRQHNLLFYEKCLTLLGQFGLCGMVIPNTWLTNLSASSFRNYVFTKYSLKMIAHYKWQVFADATISVQNVLTANQLPTTGHTFSVSVLEKFEKDNGDIYEINQKRWQLSNGNPINIFERPEFIELIDRLRELPKLNDFCKITTGTKPFQVGKGKPPQTKKILKEKPYVSEIKKDNTFRPLLRGSLMGRYKNLWNENYWISLGDWLAEPRYSANYDAPEKIVIRQTGDSLVATLDREQFVVRDNLYVISSKHPDCDLRFILAIINSKLLKWFYQKSINPETNEPLAQVKRAHLIQLPIVDPNVARQKFSNTYEQLVETTDLLLQLNRKLINNINDQKLENEIENAEKLIDKCVIEIFNISESETKFL